MIMRAVETINPKSLADALRAAAKPNVSVVAGGTDILVKLHDQITKPWPKLLVLENVKPLHSITSSKNEISIGPMVTFTEIENSKVIQKYAPQLAEAAAVAASVQIRNRATIGGNIANGSPAGDLIPPLYSLGAVLKIASASEKRIIKIEDFFVGPGKTILKPNELIVSIKISKKSNRGFFLRLATRKALAISKVSVAASISIKRKNIEMARISLGAVGPTVIRAHKTEEFLRSKELSDKIIDRACEIIKSEASPIDDIRSNALYRKEMVGVLLGRGLRKLSK